MRVTLVTHELSSTSGQGRVNLFLARHLLAHGHGVHVIARSVTPDLYQYPHFTTTLFPAIPARPHLIEGPLFMLLAARVLRLAPRDSVIVNNGTAVLAHADVNYSHFCHSSYRRMYSQNKPGFHSFPRRLYHTFCTAIDALGEQLVYHRRSSTIIAVSSHLRDELVRDAWVDPRLVNVVLNGVDTEEFRPIGSVAERSLLRERLCLPATPLLLFAGDLRSRRKGLDTILHALPHLSPDVHLLVAGDPTASPYPATVRAAQLEERVTFLGFRRDVSTLMRAADLFVFPSLYEACSLVVLEAMASGLPVITTPAAGSSEVITHGVDGVLLTDATDHRGLAAHIQALLDDTQRRQALGVAARQTALRYDWSKVMGDAEDILLARAKIKNMVRNR